jgi:hypothetical protein
VKAIFAEEDLPPEWSSFTATNRQKFNA